MPDAGETKIDRFTGVSCLHKTREIVEKSRSSSSSNAIAKLLVGACARPRSAHKKGEKRPIATVDDPYCVDRNAYLHAEDIPGNDPVALKLQDGRVVTGSDGLGVYGPSRGVYNMEGIANKVDETWTTWGRYKQLKKFAQNKEWYFQRINDDDGSIIFANRYTEFSNIIIGYADDNYQTFSTDLLARYYAMKNSKFSK